MRNMSFLLTVEQMKKRCKTVTRRLGWDDLVAGDMVMACVKCQGLGRGGRIERIWPLEIVSVRCEMLNRVSSDECAREGFPALSAAQFVEMFCDHNGCRPTDLINRIEFRFAEPLPDCAGLSKAQREWWQVEIANLGLNNGH